MKTILILSRKEASKKKLVNKLLAAGITLKVAR